MNVTSPIWKLSYVALADEDVPERAAFPPPNVKRCRLQNWRKHYCWKETDVFGGLKTLRLTLWNRRACRLAAAKLERAHHRHGNF